VKSVFANLKLCLQIVCFKNVHEKGKRREKNNVTKNEPVESFFKVAYFIPIKETIHFKERKR